MRLGRSLERRGFDPMRLRNARPTPPRRTFSAWSRCSQLGICIAYESGVRARLSPMRIQLFHAAECALRLLRLQALERGERNAHSQRDPNAGNPAGLERWA